MDKDMHIDIDIDIHTYTANEQRLCTNPFGGGGAIVNNDLPLRRCSPPCSGMTPTLTARATRHPHTGGQALRRKAR